MDIPGDTPWGERRKMFKHVIYEKRCAMCGKKFDATNAKTMYCSKRCRERKARESRKREDPLSKTAMEARKLGMSYGAYVARQEAGARG